MSAECKRLNDGTCPTCTCTGDACALGFAEAFDYRCLNGHIFASPAAPHGGPWATLVCPTCGATSLRHFTEDGDRG